MTTELMAMTVALCRYLEEIGQEKIEVDQGYYWSIPDEQKYDPSNDPNGLTLGDLNFDVEALRRIVSGEGEPVGRAFVWLGELMSAVGTKVIG